MEPENISNCSHWNILEDVYNYYILHILLSISSISIQYLRCVVSKFKRASQGVMFTLFLVILLLLALAFSSIMPLGRPKPAGQLFSLCAAQLPRPAAGKIPLGLLGE